jgi:hypothetical protein
MDRWEYKVVYGLSEDELNKWGEEGYEIYAILPPPTPPEPGMHYSPDYWNTQMTVILKRRKP